jgi:hypothetical protein
MSLLRLNAQTSQIPMYLASTPKNTTPQVLHFSNFQAPTSGKFFSGYPCSRFFSTIGRLQQLDSASPSRVLALSGVESFGFGQLSLILIFSAGVLFNASWGCNYDVWVDSCLAGRMTPLCLGHGVMDPHMGSSVVSALDGVVLAASGVFPVLLSAGFQTSHAVLRLVVLIEVAALLSLSPAGTYLFSVCRSRPQQCLGFLSICWCFHGLVVSMPFSRGYAPSLSFLNLFLTCVLSGNWSLLCQASDVPSLPFGSNSLSQSPAPILSVTLHPILSCLSMPFSDILHHHLGVGIIVLFVSQYFKAIYSSVAYTFRFSRLSHVSYNSFSSSSKNGSLALSTGSLGILASGAGNNLYLYNPFPYLSFDSLTVSSHYIHHCYIT